MTVTIHQPEFLPYYGFFRKAANANNFVLLDDVQFKKNNFQNRNKILTSTGVQYITIPVQFKAGDKINQVRIDQDNWPRQKKKIIRTIQQVYSKTPYFDETFPIIREILDNDYDWLVNLNFELIDFVFRYLGLDANLLLSSQLQLEETKTDLLVAICQDLGASTYLSGVGGAEYLELEKFQNIKVRYCSNHLEYNQTQSKESQFVPYMSIIDGLFNYGRNFKSILYE